MGEWANEGSMRRMTLNLAGLLTSAATKIRNEFGRRNLAFDLGQIPRVPSMDPKGWARQFGKARVFGTTYGHSDGTFRGPVFLDTVTRGLPWAAGRLE